MFKKMLANWIGWREFGRGVGYGMLMTLAVPAGVSLRLGWLGDNDTSVGLGFTWWTGGDGLNTSISTSYDMRVTEVANAVNTNDGNVSITVGFGF